MSLQPRPPHHRRAAQHDDEARGRLTRVGGHGLVRLIREAGVRVGGELDLGVRVAVVSDAAVDAPLEILEDVAGV